MFKRTTNYEAFRRQLRSGTRTENLEPYSDAVYDTCRMYLHHTGMAGFGIMACGDIINLFNNSDIKGLGREAMLEAIRLGGDFLECFDGFLVKYYESFGFEETSRYEFNADLAPANWDSDHLGWPDLVHMGLKES